MDIIMFGFNDWDQWEARGFRTRCGALARAIGSDPAGHRLLVVSAPHSLAMNAVRAVRGRVGGTPDSRTTLRPFAVRTVSPSVTTLEHTRLLPREGSARAAYWGNATLHDRSLRRAVRDTCEGIGMRDWVLWVADPLMAKHIGELGESVSVFDAIDDWTAHPQKRSMKAEIENGYAIVQDRADVVFTVSQALKERLGERREGVHWQPNAVDAGRFDPAAPVPSDIAGLPRPLLGYVGVIQERVDVDILTALARAMPEASIVLIGPVTAPQHVETLRSMANVHMLGERAAADVPAYVNAFDVCLVPHVDDVLTRSMNPLKVYEYLAAGKPVVASGLAQMDVPPELLARVDDPGAFVAAVRVFLDRGADDQRDRLARRTFARSRSWPARLEEMLTVVREAGLRKGVVLG